MFETIISISVGIVSLLIGLLLGYTWGNRKGESSGFDRGLRAQIRTNEALLHEYRTKFNRYQCSRKFIVRSEWDIESLTLAATSQVEMMGESIVQMLINNNVIKPYVVSQELQGSDNVWTVGVSLYCAKDPAFEEYDSLPFIRRPPRQ